MLDPALIERIDRYCSGKLNEEEIEALWAELVDRPEYYDYLETMANLMDLPIPPRPPKPTGAAPP